jgi:hypothetical protein
MNTHRLIRLRIPLAAAEWHLLDKAIDRAPNGLRADEPDATPCKRALRVPLRTFDGLGGHQ